MSKFSQLDVIIADYVGFNEVVCDPEEGASGQMEFLSLECADPELYDVITKELSEHINGNRAEKDLSDESKACWSEFVEYMKHYGTINREV